MKCVSTWTFSWKLEMISDLSPSPPGCSQSSTKITRCSLAKAGSWSVFIFSPNPDWQQAISLPSESGQRQTRRQWTGGEKFSFSFGGKHYNCWTNIFHIWTFKEGGGTTACLHFCSTLSWSGFWEQRGHENTEGDGVVTASGAGNIWV